MKNKRKIKCLWCSKKKILKRQRGWDKQKFCCIRCRQEFHSFMDERSPFYDKLRNRDTILNNSDLFVKCEICGQLARRRLSTHIKKAHKLSWEEYKKIYPNAQNECEEVRKWCYRTEVFGVGFNSRFYKGGWDTIVAERKKEIGYKCEYCDYDKYKEALIGHHKLPKQFGGKDEIKNCIIVCSNCHWHIHKKIRKVVKNKHTIEDIVQTCVKTRETNSKS